MVAELIEVLLTTDEVGTGTKEDPKKVVQRLWTKDGKFIGKIGEKLVPKEVPKQVSEVKKVVKKK